MKLTSIFPNVLTRAVVTVVAIFTAVSVVTTSARAGSYDPIQNWLCSIVIY